MSQEVEQWRTLFSTIFPKWWVVWALAQCDLESGGDPTVLTSGASPCTPQGGRGLFQITSLYYWQKYGYPNCQTFDNALQNPATNSKIYWSIMQPLVSAHPGILPALNFYNKGPNWDRTDYSYSDAILLRLPSYEL